MKLTIKLNIKSIIKAEQFLKKPFPEFDYKAEKDLKGFLYCIVLSNNKESFTYEHFINLLENKKFSEDLVNRFERECKILSQFSSIGKNNRKDQGDANEKIYITDLVSLLILEGMNPYFVLDDLQVSDLSIYADAYKKKKQNQMEEKRLWTFLSCAPHLDLKKVKTAIDFYPLPWEIENLNRKREEYIQANEKNLERFLNEGINFIKPKN